MYDFLVCTISPLEGEYEPGEPEWGFLFPAFSDRSTEIHRIDIFQKNATASQTELRKDCVKNICAELPAVDRSQ